MEKNHNTDQDVVFGEILQPTEDEKLWRIEEAGEYVGQMLDSLTTGMSRTELNNAKIRLRNEMVGAIFGEYCVGYAHGARAQQQLENNNQEGDD